MKQLIFSTIAFILSLCTHSQPALQFTHNIMRKNDSLIKQQVEYISPGNPGNDQIWDFSDLKFIDDHYELKYFYDLRDSSLLIGQEHHTLYKYRMRGDSLLIAGYENAHTLMNYPRSKLLWKFPFSYQNHTLDYFYGIGEYTRSLKIVLQGTIASTADAYGKMILPEGNVLDSVLRIHTRELFTEEITPLFYSHDSFSVNIDSIHYLLATDSVKTQIDTYRWFSEGYRYPVFETVQIQVILHDQPKEIFNTAFCYQPIEQYYGLDNDPDNLLKREKMLAESGDNNADDIKNQQEQSTKDKITYAVRTERGSSLTLDYELEQPAEIGVILLDPQGRILANYPPHMHDVGTYKRTVSLAGQQRGEYILHIFIDSEIIGEVILN